MEATARDQRCQHREIVLRDTRLVRIEARLSKSVVRVLDLAIGQKEDVPLASLHGQAILTDATQIDQHLESVRAWSSSDEVVATSREQILNGLPNGAGEWSTRVDTIYLRPHAASDFLRRQWHGQDDDCRFG